jgi:hypothetical protein
MTCRAACCDLVLQVAPFDFLSREEKRRRVGAANMIGHFIDGFTGLVDIGLNAETAFRGRLVASQNRRPLPSSAMGLSAAGKLLIKFSRFLIS